MLLQDLLGANLPPLSIHKLALFLKLATTLKTSIEISQLDAGSPPAQLSHSICHILSLVLREPSATIQEYWAALKEEVWASSFTDSLSWEEVTQLNEHALIFNLSYRQQYPPTRVCLSHGCPNSRPNGNAKKTRTLTEPSTYKATLFTLREGSLPIYTTSMYCRACNTRYYPNYFVHKKSGIRTYYSGIPSALQVSQHFYIDCELLEFFASGQVHGWLSSMNCTRIYNESISRLNSHVLNNPASFSEQFLQYSLQFDSPPLIWQSLELQDKHVLNGFFLYALLLDTEKRETTLLLSHDEPSQCERLKAGLAERNKRMEGTGQDAYTHACDRCFLVFEDKNGVKVKIQASVCDGTTIGHPCCTVHDCKNLLSNNRHRFCSAHHLLNTKCAVVTCSIPQQDGFQTCSNPHHRSLEDAYFKHGKGIFILRERLKNAGVSSSPSHSPSLAQASEEDVSQESTVPDEEVMVEANLFADDSTGVLTVALADGQAAVPEVSANCDGKPESGNRKLRAFFGRRRSHNEQFMMRPCGIILARATFFGSEAVSAVNKFAKAVFPTPESTPEFLVFDNNCQLDAHLKKIKDSHFKNTGKPVDAFHFTSKHKITDIYCQQNCNPAAFPELIQNGRWRINMSICEQTNVWVGGFQAILRDMEAVRLKDKGHGPWNIPFKAIFPE